jgi:hypothetical protein
MLCPSCDWRCSAELAEQAFCENKLSSFHCYPERFLFFETALDRLFFSKNSPDREANV